MSLQLPRVKPPSWNVPPLRNLPTIPNVGCVSGNATTQIGGQMGNFPDVQALPHIKQLNKIITEQIGTLLEGKLPDVPRGILYETRRIRLVSELAQIVGKAAEIAAAMQADVSGAIAAANEKIGELNQAQSKLLQIPEAARTAIQQKRLTGLMNMSAN